MTAAMAEDAASFEAFWSFSLDRYGREGVAAACLELQDAHDADVNVVLLCLFAAAQGIGLSRADLEAIVSGEGGRWHREVVVPLRAARRAMKAPPARLEADRVEGARNRLKAVELESERLEQMLLFAAIEPLLAAGAVSRRAGREACLSFARSSLLAYFQLSGRQPAAIERLVQACID